MNMEALEDINIIIVGVNMINPKPKRWRDPYLEYADDVKAEAFKIKKMIIERRWAMPNSETFLIKPIRELIQEEMVCGVVIDPFSGNSKIATVTNDINPQYNTNYHLDALDFLRLFIRESVDLILFDPPYSPRQLSECYKKLGKSVNFETTQSSFWSDLKNEITRIIKPGGKVISFGWNSQGMGKNRGFRIKRILLVPHGGQHNDTICVVEIKVQSSFQTPIYKENLNSEEDTE